MTARLIKEAKEEAERRRLAFLNRPAPLPYGYKVPPMEKPLSPKLRHIYEEPAPGQ